MYGRTMSIPDGLIVKYFRLALGAPAETVAEVERRLADGENPRDLKRRLARELVARYHESAAAEAAEAYFDRIFVERGLPDEIPEVTVSLREPDAALAWVLREAGLAASASEGRRLVGQGAVRIDRERVTDPDLRLAVGTTKLLQVGSRRFARVRLEAGN
jgi:tyrosyl-tRNA synthetase